jgi:hypothetical protein
MKLPPDHPKFMKPYSDGSISTNSMFRAMNIHNHYIAFLMFIYVYILPVEPEGLILPMTILGTVYEIGFTVPLYFVITMIQLIWLFLE